MDFRAVLPTLASHVGAQSDVQALLLIQLPANTSGKWAEVAPSA